MRDNIQVSINRIGVHLRLSAAILLGFVEEDAEIYREVIATMDEWMFSRKRG